MKNPLRYLIAVTSLIALAALAAVSARSVALAETRAALGAKGGAPEKSAERSFATLRMTRPGAAEPGQTASGAQKEKADNAPAGNAKNGKAIYTADGCYECHGREAQGGAGTGPKLGPSPIPFAAFAFQVRTPRDQMPPYTAKVLSDADLADIYAFVQSEPQPPKVDSIPQLK